MSRLSIFLFVILVLALLYAAYQYALIARARAIGMPIAASTKPYEQYPAGATQFILVMGDSTAVGVGAKDPAESIAGRIGAQYPQADLTNLGVSGADLSDLLAKIPNVHRDHYDLIVLQIGANDVVYGSVGKVPERIHDALLWASEHGDHVILMSAGNIGLSPVFKWPLSAYISHRTREVRADFIAEAGKFPNVSYVDLYLSREEDPFGKNIPYYYGPDHFHPSGNGYADWFTKVKEELPTL